MALMNEAPITQPLDLEISKEGSNTPTDSPYPSDQDVELQAQHTPGDNPANAKVSTFKSLGLLDRFLAVWILLAMIIGVILGNFVPNTGPALQKGQFVGVSVPIGKKTYLQYRSCANLHRLLAVGLLVMMYPILCKIKYETLHVVFQQRKVWVQIGFSIIANWIIAPFVMVGSPSVAFVSIY